MVIKSLQSSYTLIDLRPNKSATWYSTKWIIGLIFIVMFTIAIGWSIAGAWIILPFAGLEFGVFTFLIYHVCKQTYRSERIHIYSDHLKLEWINGKQYFSKRLSRTNLYVAYHETPLDWQMPKLIIFNNEEKAEVGKFLNLKDKSKLKNMLEDTGLIIVREHWWKN